MKNTPAASNPIDKIYELASSETRKFEIRRKLSAAHEKRQETAENCNLLVENGKDRAALRPNEPSFPEEEDRQTPQERPSSKEKQTALRLPNIKPRKNTANLEK